MKILLDTHSFLWFISGDSNLSQAGRSIIEDETSERFLSVASLWEMAIKISIGKLKLTSRFQDLIPYQLDRNGIKLLNINIDHTAQLISIPFHHRDPFDRMIIAQALAEELPVVSADESFDAYSISRIW